MKRALLIVFTVAIELPLMAGLGCGGQVSPAHVGSDAAVESSSSDASASADVAVVDDSGTTDDTGTVSDAGKSGSCSACAGTCCGTTCIDTQNDAHNCGRCGHDCLGGTCVKGACQAFPIASLPSNETGFALTLDADNVYFASGAGSLYTCPKTGCTTPSTLLTGLNLPYAILYDPQSKDIFVADTYNDAVEAYTTTGTNVFRVTSAGSHPTALALGATSLYWSIAGGVVRSTKDGKTQTAIVSGIPGQITWLALDPSGATVYGGMLETGAVPGSSPALFSASTSSAGAWSYFAGTASVPQTDTSEIAVQGSTVIWITLGGDDAGAAGGLFTCPTTGCASPTVIPGTSPLSYGTCFFVDATSIHYVEDGNFYACPVGGCPGGPTLVASNVFPTEAAGCAEDATSYYFLDDRVMRLAK